MRSESLNWVRPVIGGAVIVATVATGLWVFFAKRRQVNTPALDAVASLMGGGTERSGGRVKGTVAGRRVEYWNQMYRHSMWTELSVAATGGQPYAMKFRRDGKGATLEEIYTLDGPPAETLFPPEVQKKLLQLRPQKVKRDGDGVHLMMDHTVKDDAEARALVQLGVDLAER